MLAEKGDRFLRRAAPRGRQRIQPTPDKLFPQYRLDRGGIVETQLWCRRQSKPRQPADNPRELGLRIGVKRVSGPFRRSLLGLLAPRLEPRRRWTIQKQSAPEKLVDRRIDLGPQGGHDPRQPLGFTALFLELFEIVADWLFAWKRRQRSEDRGEESDRLILFGGAITEAVGSRVNIHEAPVDLALGRAPLQCRYRAGKGFVHQHRPIDKRNIFNRFPRSMNGHDPFEKCVSLRPCPLGQV